MALVPFPGNKQSALSLPPDDDFDEESGAGKMSFLSHLDELRRRIINSCRKIFLIYLRVSSSRTILWLRQSAILLQRDRYCKIGAIF